MDAQTQQLQRPDYLTAASTAPMRIFDETLAALRSSSAPSRRVSLVRVAPRMAGRRPSRQSTAS
jgi:hypothetical protein